MVYRDHRPVFQDSSPSCSRSRNRRRDHPLVFRDSFPSRSRSCGRSHPAPRRYPERGRTTSRASSRPLPRKAVPHKKLSQSPSSLRGHSRSKSRSRGRRGNDSGRYSRSRTPSRHRAEYRSCRSKKKCSPSRSRRPSCPPEFVDSPAMSRSRSRYRSPSRRRHPSRPPEFVDSPVVSRSRNHYRSPSRSRGSSQPPVFVDSPAVSRSRSRRKTRASVDNNPSQSRHRSRAPAYKELSRSRHKSRSAANRKASSSHYRSRAPVFKNIPSPLSRLQWGRDRNEGHFKHRGNTQSHSRGASPIYKIHGRVKISPPRYKKSGYDDSVPPRPKSRGRTRSRPPVHQKDIPSLADLLGPTFHASELKLGKPKPKAAPTGPSTRKRFTEEQLARIPHGDTRWPAPGEEWGTPLIMRYKDQGKHADVLYHLIYQNNASEAREWLQQIEITTAEAMDRLPGKSVPVARIMNALNKKKLRPLCDGKRAKIWLLDELNEAVWGSMKLLIADMGALRIMSEWETFEVFGLCIKENNRDILLISQKFDEQSRALD